MYYTVRACDRCADDQALLCMRYIKNTQWLTVSLRHGYFSSSQLGGKAYGVRIYLLHRDTLLLLNEPVYVSPFVVVQKPVRRERR